MKEVADKGKSIKTRNEANEAEKFHENNPRPILKHPF